MSGRRSISNSFNVITIDDPVSVQAQYAPNDNPTQSQIHDTFQEGDLYMRTRSTDSSWSAWHKIVGENGDETDYTFAISQYKTTSSATTAPSDISSSDWQDAPMAVTSSKPYLWSRVQKKVWNDAVQDYVVDSTRYIRLTGEGGEDYIIESTVGSVTIDSNQTTGSLSTTLSFYKKEGGQGRVAYSCFCTIFKKKGSTYTAIKQYTTAGAAVTYTHAAGSGVAELTAANYDAIVVCIYNAASTSHSGYLTELEIPVRKNGDDSRRVDLDNEHEDFLYDDAGNRKSSIVTSQARLYNGSSQITTGITWAVSCDDGSNWVSQGNTYTSGNAKAKISSGGLLTIEEVYVTTAKIKVRATYDSKNYYAEFTANRQTQDKYELVLSPNSIPYNPSSYSPVTIGVSAKRTSIAGGSPTDITWGAYTNKDKISTTSGKGYLRLFVAIKTQVGQSVYDYIPTQVTSDFQVTAEFASERGNVYFMLVRYDDANTSDSTGQLGTLVDWENVPICKSQNSVVYEIVFTESWARVDNNNIVTARLKGYAYKVDGSTKTALNSVTIRHGYILNDSDTYATTSTNSSGYFDCGDWFDDDNIIDFGKNSANIFAAIIIGGVVVQANYVTIAKQGANGQSIRGKTGRFYYYGGEFDNTDTTKTFKINDAETPYFSHGTNAVTGLPNCHVYNPSTNPSSDLTMAQMWANSNQSWNNAPWQTFTNDFQYLMTRAVFSDQAYLGSFVVNTDWLISQHGEVNHVASTAYTKFYPEFVNGGDLCENFDVNMNYILAGSAYFVGGKKYYIKVGGSSFSSGCQLNVRMYNGSSDVGNTINLTSSSPSGTITFEPTTSGTYYLRADCQSSGMTAKLTAYVECFIPNFAVDGLTGSSYQNDGTFSGIVTANLSYSPTGTKTGNDDVTLNPSSDKCGTFLISGITTVKNIYLPLASQYDGLEYNLIQAVYVNDEYKNCNINRSGSEQIYVPTNNKLTAVTAFTLPPNSIVKLKAISGSWYVVQGLT